MNITFFIIEIDPELNLTGLVLKVEFKCQIQIQHSFRISFKNNITRSHCSYCECLPGNNVNCYKFDINKNRTSVCQNCRRIPFVISCSYCSHPFYSKDLSHVNTSEAGEFIKVPGFECVKCQCSRSGTIGCNYNNQDRCFSVPGCQQMFERLRNGTSKAKYICKNCFFDGDSENPFSKWRVNVHNLSILCSCEYNGGVTCRLTKTQTIGEIEITRTCNHCFTLESLKEEFQNKGFHFMLMQFSTAIS